MRRFAQLRPYLPDLPDALGVGGAAALVYGIACIYVPAAWIAGGLLALTGALLLVRKERKR